MENILNPTTHTAEEFRDWNWDTAVPKVRTLYSASWKKISKELLEELLRAKRILNKGPGNPGSRYTWKGFCEDAFAGSPTRRTIDNWLKRHEYGESWKAERDADPLPKAIDLDSFLVKKVQSHKDGTITIQLEVSEYPNERFTSKISV